MYINVVNISTVLQTGLTTATASGHKPWFTMNTHSGTLLQRSAKGLEKCVRYIKRGFVVLGFFSVHFSFTGLKNFVRYTGFLLHRNSTELAESSLTISALV